MTLLRNSSYAGVLDVDVNVNGFSLGDIFWLANSATADPIPPASMYPATNPFCCATVLANSSSCFWYSHLFSVLTQSTYSLSPNCLTETMEVLSC